MSRNYELMREMDGIQVLSSSRSIEPAFIPGERYSRPLPRQLDGDLMEDLVQQVFLQAKEKQPRMVVFAAVDHGNGCSQTAASVAAALATNTRGVVCLVEGNFRSPGLPKMLGMTNRQGLTDSLLEEGSIQSFVEPIWSGSLWLLSSGSLGAGFPQPFDIGTHEGSICRVTEDVRFSDRRCAAHITVRGCDRTGTTIGRNGLDPRIGVHPSTCDSNRGGSGSIFQDSDSRGCPY